MKHIVSVGKAVLVLALMAWVFSNVQWGDAVISAAPDGSEQRLAGSIVGGEDWQADQVRFVPSEGADAGEEIVVEQGGDSPTKISPGFLTYWRNLDPLLFGIGALLFFFTANFAAVRWWWLLRINDLRVRPLEALRLSWIGIFFNNVVPGQTGGDLVKAIYVVRRCPEQRAEAIVSVLVDRILGLASLALLGAVVVLFALDDYAYLAVGIWLVLFGVAGGACLAFSRRLRRGVGLDRLLQRLPGRVGDTLKKIDTAVFHYRGHTTGVGFWMLAGIGNHAIAVLSWFFVGRALGVDLPLLEYFVLIPVINIVSAVPIAPNGWGVGEALFSRLFGDWGAANLAAGGRRLMATQGVALSILYRIHLTLWSLLGGLLLLIDPHRVTRRELEAEAVVPDEGQAAPS